MVFRHTKWLLTGLAKTWLAVWKDLADAWAKKVSEWKNLLRSLLLEKFPASLRSTLDCFMREPDIDELLTSIDNKMDQIKDKKFVKELKKLLEALKKDWEEIQSVHLSEKIIYIEKKKNEFSHKIDLYSLLAKHYWSSKLEWLKKSWDNLLSWLIAKFHGWVSEFQDIRKNPKKESIKRLVKSTLINISLKEWIEFLDVLIASLWKNTDPKIITYLKAKKLKLSVQRYEELIATKNYKDAKIFAQQRSNGAWFAGNKRLLAFWNKKVDLANTK